MTPARAALKLENVWHFDLPARTFRVSRHFALDNDSSLVCSPSGVIVAMACDPPDFERYRPYLLSIARSVSSAGSDLAIDAADAVHQTMLRAYQCNGQFRGDTEAERAAWLREILWNCVRDVHRRANRRLDEQALARRLERSSAGFAGLLVATDPSPSSQARQNEHLVRLGMALIELSDDQRQAIELRYLHELPVGEIAEQMNRSKASVAGLLQRGLRELRRIIARD